MRLWIFSDLHRDIGQPWVPPAVPVADVAVVAGDVGQGLYESVAWLADAVRPHMRVVLVAGNHEFYRRTHPEELHLGRRAARSMGIDLLEDDTAEIDGVAFSGCTLWTDYALDGDSLRAASMEDARRSMNDHRRITWSTKPVWKRFRPEEAAGLHRASRAFLSDALEPDPADRRTRVVVTHHAPSARSIEPRYAGKPLNPCYASHLDDLIERSGPALWVHGHVHGSHDYRIGATRLVCNPKGYCDENGSFDPGLVVEVP